MWFSICGQLERADQATIWRQAVANEPKDGGKRWTDHSIRGLKQLAKENTPTCVIGLKLGRTEEAVRLSASGEDVSLKHTSWSPCNRTKK